MPLGPARPSAFPALLAWQPACCLDSAESPPEPSPALCAAGRRVVLRLRHFPARWYRYYSVTAKLSLIAAALTRGRLPEGSETAVALMLNSLCPGWAALREAVHDQLQRELALAVPGEGSVPPDVARELVTLVEDRRMLHQLLFAPGSYIETREPGQRVAPRILETDRGPIERFASHQAIPGLGEPGSLLHATLRMNHAHVPLFLEVGPERILPNTTDSRRLAERGIVILATWDGVKDAEPWRPLEDPSLVLMDALAQCDSRLRFVPELPVLLESDAPANSSRTNCVRLIFQGD